VPDDKHTRVLYVDVVTSCRPGSGEQRLRYCATVRVRVENDADGQSLLDEIAACIERRRFYPQTPDTVHQSQVEP
jgi:hypothetical protein